MMIALWVGELIHCRTAIAAESPGAAAVFQAMISPAPYHVIRRAAMRSKTVTPPDWTWSKSPVRAMYAARLRAMSAIRVSRRTAIRPRAVRWALIRSSVWSSVSSITALVSDVPAADVATGLRTARSVADRTNGRKRRAGDRMAPWSTRNAAGGIDLLSGPGVA